MILTYVNPSRVPLQIVARLQNGMPATMVSGTVRVYHFSAAGAEVVDLAPTALVSSTPIWRYNWAPGALAEGYYLAEYTMTDASQTYAPVTEDLIVRAAVDLSALATSAALVTVDGVVDAIKLKTDNLPSDPADQSAVEAAITAATSPLATAVALATVDGIVDGILLDTAAIDTRLPADPADESAIEAAITAATSSLATSANVTAAVAALQGADGDTLKTLSDQIDGLPTDADVEAACEAGLTDYDAATGTDVTTSASAVVLALQGGDGDTLETISDQLDAVPDDADVAADCGTALATYTAAKTGDLSGLALTGEAAAAVVGLALAGEAAAAAAVIVGGDGDTLESLSDQIDALPTDSDVQASAAAALTAYDAATGTDVSTSEGVVTGAISTSEGVVTGAIGTSEGVVTVAVGAVPAATEAVVAGAHGAGAYDGLTPAQTLRDAMALAPTPGVPAAGSVDALLVGIDSKTTQLPSDPADQSAVEAAITAATTATLAGVTTDHGAGAYNGVATGQEVRDALALALTPGTIPAPGSIDKHLDAIDQGAVHFGASMSDDGTTPTFVVWGEYDHGRDVTLTGMSAIVRNKLGVSLINLGAGAGPTAEGTFLFSCATNALPYNEPLFLDVAATDGVDVWNGNVGFVRVS